VACAVLLVAGGVAGLATTLEQPSPTVPNVIADPAGRSGGPEIYRETSPPGSPSAPPSSPTGYPAGGPVPAGMTAVSVTATAPDALWVLGDAPCAARVCTSVVRSLDGGRSFVGLPAPRDPVGTPGAGLGTVSDLRFGSSRDGFAYGGSLWSTHDGAGSWSRVDLGHPVKDVAVTGGVAWAAVAAGEGWELWRSPAAEDAWEPVELSEPLTGGAPDLQVASGRAYVLAGDQLLVSAGGSLEARAAPCAPGLGGSLSPAADGALWVICPTGTAAGVWLAPSASAPFRPVPVAEHLPNSLRLGAVSAESAVLAVPGAQRLRLVSPNGSLRAANGPTVEGGMQVRFLGFTDERVGYAVLERPHPALWRTEDGGLSWRDVPLG